MPPPSTKADEIVTPCGGMYYGQEAPGLPRFVEEGMHFEKDQPLFIIEVMKMFNKVYAPFSGTVDEVLVDTDGVIISKGQTIFKITPDEKMIIESPEDVAARRRTVTHEFLTQLA